MSLRAQRRNPRVFAIASFRFAPFAMTEYIFSWEASNPEVVDVAEKFIFANCYNSQVAGIIFRYQSQ